MKKKHRKTILMMSLLLAVAVTGACVHRGDSMQVEGKYSSAANQSTFSKHVEFLNRSLARVLGVVDITYRMNGDILTAGVTLMNQSRGKVKVLYRFSWFDDSGLEVDPGTDAWTPLIINGKEEKSIQATAPAPSATTFKIIIKKQ